MSYLCILTEERHVCLHEVGRGLEHVEVAELLRGEREHAPLHVRVQTHAELGLLGAHVRLGLAHRVQAEQLCRVGREPEGHRELVVGQLVLQAQGVAVRVESRLPFDHGQRVQADVDVFLKHHHPRRVRRHEELDLTLCNK